MNSQVKEALIALFKEVADACDGDESSKWAFPPIKDCYERIMKIPEVLEFYGTLVDARHAEVAKERLAPTTPQ